ncbi:MAG: type II toxin-antitoxin system ParD family antitoxin, partial [Nostoc sp. ChiQUE02]|uniref:type II toxin-antitoxin system ParD family antitoxin n=1 Tax=Nostoc sp. ChiQUE02 TaxID=3075377 RepID=UPI003D1618C9
MDRQRTTQNVSLTPDFNEFISSLVNSGKYKSASEVVRQALRLLQQQVSSSNPKRQGNSQESATINSAVSDKRLNMFSGSGEMRERIRNLDWASTSVGSVETWPQSLRATIRTLLGSRYPMILLWGQDLVQIYNDAYTSSLASQLCRVRQIFDKLFEVWLRVT